MNRILIRPLLALVLTLACVASAACFAAPAPGTIDQARNSVYPALINIRVVAKHYSDGRAVREPAGGSGVIVTADGYALTNFHVAGHTTFVSCTLQTGRVFNARVVVDDPATDLSVLKLSPPDGGKYAFPHADLGDSDNLPVGTYVLAMGNPLMLASSMTLGIVSNPHRVFTDFLGSEISERQLESGEQTGMFTKWIQHDALILPGNSGGPLVNLDGKVIGINELGRDGVGFAIPSNIARTLLRATLKQGHIVRGTLDLSVLPVSKLGRTTGALVSSVEPGGAAAAAGIRAGDFIRSVNGAPVTVRFFEQVPDFYQLAANLPPGRDAKLSLERDGRVRTVSVRVALMQPSVGDERECPLLGATVMGITPNMAYNQQIAETNGVVLTGERQGKAMEIAQPPIEPGDVIWAIDGKPIHGIGDFLDHVDLLRPHLSSGGSTVLSLDRDGAQILSVVKLETKSPPDTSTALPQAWIGIGTQVLTTQLSDALGVSGQTGQRITEVYPGTQADIAGLKAGDVIVAVDGTPLQSSRPQDSNDLLEAIRYLTPGDKAVLTILRDKVSRSIPVTLEDDPQAAPSPPSSTSDELEFSVRSTTRSDAIKNRWPITQTGVIVTDVTMGGWAHIGGLLVGDLVLSVDGQSTTDDASFKKVLDAAVKRKASEVTLFVRRDATTSFVFIEPDWSRGKDGVRAVDAAR